LNEVFQDVFDDEELVVGRPTTAADIAGWDSLMHIRLILEIEKAFKVRFLSSEVSALHSVGDLIDLLESKQAANSA
jgi:acyl carrier protein